MSPMIRRQFLQGLNAALATCAIPSSTHSAAASIVCTTRPRLASTEGCIFVRDLGRKAQGNLGTLDLWTARVSIVDLRSLPADLNKVVVYDDVFSNSNLYRQFRDAARSIPSLFDLNRASCSYGFHLNGLTNVEDILAEFSFRPSGTPSTRIAVIDIESCGVTRLEWHDILPVIRSQYDLIVGFHHSLGETMGDWDRFCEEPVRQDTYLIETLKCCDLSFLTSDGLLGLGGIDASEDSGPPLTNLLCEILPCLSSPSIRKRIQRAADASMFCVGPIKTTDESQNSFEIARQQAMIADGFADGVIHQRYSNEPPLILDTLALWPLRAEL